MLDSVSDSNLQATSMVKKALVIEDDDDVALLLRAPLEELGYEVMRAADGNTGLEMALSGAYVLIILDLMLPGLHGMDVCREIRRKNEEVPIIVVSMASSEVDTVLLLELGADDYLTKPFREGELKARIRTILRRSARAKATDLPSVLIYDELEIDFTKRIVTLKGLPVELTPREFDLLAALASRPGYPFSRDQLNEAVYGQEVSGYDHSVTAHINRLRHKIEPDPDSPKYILTVRGVGYRFAEKK